MVGKIMYERPGKQQMFVWLSSWLKQNTATEQLVLDAACQWAWHKKLVFPENLQYVGVDISMPNLKKAKTNFPDCEFIHSDILSLNRNLNPEAFDFIVSTNTMEHLAVERRFDAISIFYNLLKCGGKLLFTLADLNANEKLISSLPEMFSSVEPFYYRNHVTKAFENMVCDEHNSYDLTRFSTPSQKGISSLAKSCFVFEKFTSGQGCLMNNSGLFVCTKKGASSRRIFEFKAESLRQNELGIWRATDSGECAR